MARSISRRVYDTSGILVAVDSETNYVRLVTGYAGSAGVDGAHLSVVVLTPEQTIQLVDHLTRARIEIEDRRIDEQVRQDGVEVEGFSTIRELRRHLRDAHEFEEGMLLANTDSLLSAHRRHHEKPDERPRCEHGHLLVGGGPACKPCSYNYPA